MLYCVQHYVDTWKSGQLLLLWQRQEQTKGNS